MFVARTILTGLRARRRGPIGMSEWSDLQMRVGVADVDFNLHMNNGRFLSLMDLGRTDFAVRAGVVRAAMHERWQPVAGGVRIRFRKSLPAFSRYVLRTRMPAWDDKWFFFEQQFLRDGDLAAVAHVKVLFKGRGGAQIPTSRLLAAVGHKAPSPELPDHLRMWLESEQAASSEIVKSV